MMTAASGDETLEQEAQDELARCLRIWLDDQTSNDADACFTLSLDECRLVLAAFTHTPSPSARARRVKWVEAGWVPRTPVEVTVNEWTEAEQLALRTLIKGTGLYLEPNIIKLVGDAFKLGQAFGKTK